jgi:hypothetical protein
MPSRRKPSSAESVMHSPALTDDRLVPVWLAIGLIFALLVGVCAGVLERLNGQPVPAALLTGGACLAGS